MVEKYTLGNGVRVLCERMESIRSAAAGVWVGAGSRYEDAALGGVSHFIEHMLFKGTRRRTARQIAEEIDAIGGQIDAFTAKDCTCFYTRTLDGHLAIGLDVLSDILMNAKLAGTDIALERNVILEEINMYGDSPEDLVHEQLAKTVWRDDPLGRPILGDPASLARINQRVMKAYLAERYTPQNTVISVAGSFDAAELLKTLEQKFGKLGSGKRAAGNGAANAGVTQIANDMASTAASATANGVAADVGGRDTPPCFHRDTAILNKDTEQVHLCLGYDGIELGDDDHYALQLANYIFGGGMSSILFQKVREELGLVYSVFSFLTPHRHAGLYTIYAGMKPENAERVLRLVVDELRAFVKGGMTAELLGKAKEQFKGSFMMGLESPNGRMAALGKAELLLGRVRTPDEIVGVVEGVTLDRVYHVMERVFNADGYALSAVGRIDDKLENKLRAVGG